MVNLEVESRRKVAEIEKENMERLKDFSPYLVNLVECFDDVCILFLIIFFLE
jgi:hypothetical protein